MPRAMQLTVVLENKPGQLARLAAVLKRAKVNILAISVVDTVEAGMVRVVVDSAAQARQALAKAGMAVAQHPVLALNLPNEPGSLQAVAARLAAAGMNLNYVYGSVTAKATEGYLVLGVDKLAEALKAV